MVNSLCLIVWSSTEAEQLFGVFGALAIGTHEVRHFLRGFFRYSDAFAVEPIVAQVTPDVESMAKNQLFEEKS